MTDSELVKRLRLYGQLEQRKMAERAGVDPKQYADFVVLTAADRLEQLAGEVEALRHEIDRRDREQREALDRALAALGEKEAAAMTPTPESLERARRFKDWRMDKDAIARELDTVQQPLREEIKLLTDAGMALGIEIAELKAGMWSRIEANVRAEKAEARVAELESDATRLFSSQADMEAERNRYRAEVAHAAADALERLEREREDYGKALDETIYKWHAALDRAEAAEAQLERAREALRQLHEISAGLGHAEQDLSCEPGCIACAIQGITVAALAKKTAGEP